MDRTGQGRQQADADHQIRGGCPPLHAILLRKGAYARHVANVPAAPMAERHVFGNGLRSGGGTDAEADESEKSGRLLRHYG